MRKQHTEPRVFQDSRYFHFSRFAGPHVSLRVEDLHGASHGAQATYGIYSVSDLFHTTVASFRSPPPQVSRSGTPKKEGAKHKDKNSPAQR